MPLTRSFRPLAAGVVCFGLALVAGCSPSTEKSDATKPEAAAAAQAGSPTSPAALPVAEFQQPPVLPPVDPLPRMALAPMDVSAVSVASEAAVAANANPLNSSNSVAASDPPADRPRTGKNSGRPFDPIKTNGPIFVDWPKPQAALIITGMEEGYLEPCGCAGMDHMKGGMGRRYSLFQQLRNDGWPVVGLDVGGLIHGWGSQAVQKYFTTVEAKSKTGYDAVAFGADDLRLPAGDLLSVAAGVDGKPSMFVASNVGLLSRPGEIVEPSRVVQAGGLKIGVAAILGKKYQAEIRNPELEMLDPETALEKIAPELKQKADFLVLLAHATRDESIALAKRFPQFNVVVASDGQPEPPAEPETIEGTETLLINVGRKGGNAIVLGLFGDAKPSWRYQRVPLDSRFPAAAEMKALMAAYQEQLKTLGFAGLGLRPAAHPLLETHGRFIGTKKCAESCHEISYEIWKKSFHAHAYKTLAELTPPRNFDPECVSCHVTGWHPTKYFPYQGGYESLEKTRHLVNVGCEDCHGPGEKHAAAELSGSEELKLKYRKAMVVTKEESKKQQCYTCHDGDNSPEFDFDKYWPFVEHYEQSDDE